MVGWNGCASPGSQAAEQQRCRDEATNDLHADRTSF
jgi:hypothetical protein